MIKTQIELFFGKDYTFFLKNGDTFLNVHVLVCVYYVWVCVWVLLGILPFWVRLIVDIV